jgi:hypothetical protein
MSHLTRGPGRMPGIGSKAHASREPTPFCSLIASAAGGDGVIYLTRGPSLLGIGSKGQPSGEPTPFSVQIVNASGGDSMSSLATTTPTIPDFQTLLQATP